jgi:polyadenylate-binding protein
MNMPPNVPNPAGGRGRPGYKYTPNARNAPNAGPNANAGNSGAAPNANSGDASANGNKPVINAAMLASLPVDQQKRLLGENLFAQVQTHAPPQFVGKVTGMLLEMDNSELLHLLESPETLKERVDEAMEAINEALAEANKE